MSKKKYPLIPFSIIEAAIQGDIEAINYVVKHYEKYISILAKNRIYFPNGKYKFVIDEEIKKQLEVKLISAILKFKLY